MAVDPSHICQSQTGGKLSPWRAVEIAVVVGSLVLKPDPLPLRVDDGRHGRWSGATAPRGAVALRTPSAGTLSASAAGRLLERREVPSPATCRLSKNTACIESQDRQKYCTN